MKRNRKRWWTRLITLLAVLTVAAAAISAGFTVLIDAVPGYRIDLQNAVARAVGHPARIGSMALTWSGPRPTLDLRNVALLDARGAPLLELRRIRLGLSPTRLITGPRTPDRVEIDGLQLAAAIDADGQLHLDGIDLSGRGDRSLADDLARFAQLRLHDVSLRLRDARLGAQPPLQFRLEHASLRHGRAGYRVDAQLLPPATLARRVRVSAQLDGSLADRNSLHGRWTLAVEDLAGWPWLAAQLRPGTALALDDAQLEASGAIDAGRPGATRLRLQADQLSARIGDAPVAAIRALAIDAELEPVDGGWRLQLPDATLSGARGPWPLDGLTATQTADGTQTLIAPRLRLDDLAPWLGLLRAVPDSQLRLADARGDLAALRLIRAAPPAGGEPRDLSIQARLVGLGLASHGEQPGFAALDGELQATADRGVVQLSGTPLRLQLPKAFAQALPIDELHGELRWARSGDGWQIDAPALALRLGSSSADGLLQLTLHPQGRVPHLKLDMQLKSDAVAALKPYMPINWGPNSRAWLERAIQRARVTGGHLLIDAPLTPRDAGNRPTIPWRLTLDVDDAVLAFAPDWPAAEGIAAQLVFHDHGLDILGRQGTLGGLDARRLEARIADFSAAELVLSADIAGDAGQLYRLFRDSPLKTRLSGLIGRTEASGPVRGDLQLRIPLNVPQPPVDASGTLQVDGVTLSVRGMAEPLREVRGQLVYGKSIAAEAITARLYDTVLRARITTEPGKAEPVLSGEFELQPGRADGLSAIYVPAWLRSGLSGSTEARLRLPLGGADAGRLRISSDLQGIASSLPAPLAKTAGASLPLQLALSGDAGSTRLQVAVADELKVGIRFADPGADNGSSQIRGIEAVLGASAGEPRAEADGLVVGGAPETLDLAGWIGVIGSAGSGSEGGAAGLPLVRADVRAQRTSLRRWTFGPMRLLALPSGVGSGIRVRAEGAASGTVDWQPENGGSVVARLDQVAVEALPPLPPSQAGVAPPDSPFDPTRAPLFDIDAKALSLGDVSLGHLQIATARVADGQRIDRLALAGGRLDGSASGNWLRREAASSAALDFDVRSDAIGDVLRVFGYTPNLGAEDARFTGSVVWPRVPAGLELSQATGDIAIRLKRGALKAVEPGAGRVLGLVNLYALPRRLLFDFKDVVADGLGFDTLKGRFKLADGNAVTDDLDIDSPSLKIEMRGRIGLAARDYDQKVTVFPDISTGVTVGATLLGGPIAGGILLVAQQLFDKPFNQLGSFSYRVTGSWDDPTVLQGGEAVPATAGSPASYLNPATEPARTVDASNG
ncbi:MAG: TIGR02099 family protein [Xanthomonadaceae bacterium]|nr:TIGR02099 family protein [Xanthomonadaceae bacterium]